jgi:hypothetical protein
MSRVLTGSEQLRNLFSALTEQTFQVELGVADPPLIDYLSNLLIRFTRIDTIFRLRDTVGRRLEEVADMLMEAEQCEDRPKSEVLTRKPSSGSRGSTGKTPSSTTKLKENAHTISPAR